jgi:hypothetical protein
MQRPVRIAQEFACKKDHVRLSGSDNPICLQRLSDEADRSGENVRFTPDAFRERRLVSWDRRNLGVDGQAARGTVDQIHALAPETSCENDRVVYSPAAFFPVRG